MAAAFDDDYYEVRACGVSQHRGWAYLQCVGGCTALWLVCFGLCLGLRNRRQPCGLCSVLLPSQQPEDVLRSMQVLWTSS
jgi:hypothetical protein